MQLRQPAFYDWTRHDEDSGGNFASCCGTRGFRQHLLWIEFQKNVNIEGSKLNHVIEALWIFLRCLTQFSPYIRFPTLSPERFSLEKMGNPSWLRHVPPLPPPSPSTGAKFPKHPRSSSSRGGAPTGRQRKSAHSPRPSASSRRCSTNPNSSGTWNKSAAPSFSTSASSGLPSPTLFQVPVKGSRSDRTST